MRQLIFDDFIESDDNLLHKFNITEKDSNYKMLTHTFNGHKNIIKNSFDVELNKKELMAIVKRAVAFKKHIYCWTVVYEEDKRFYGLAVRFGNNTTKSLSAEEYIHAYFTEELKDKL